MAKKRIGTKSKRITCHKRYKILRKIKEHHRKLRKESKRSGHLQRRKDPGVPNSLPFKKDILKHAEEFKIMSNEVHKFNILNAGKLLDAPSHINQDISRCNLKDIDRLVTEADVILEVLDSRDPLGTRSTETEQKVLSANKRLILILNKIDLVPKSNLQLWLNYLRRSFTVIPFKANTQKQSAHLSRRKILWHKEVNLDGKNQGKHGQGVDELLSLLANYSRTTGTSGNARLSLTVGVVGFPNTGKSAIINTLKRHKVCASSNIPGLTKECQRIRLDKNVFLIDSPGIVVSKGSDPSDLVLKNCLSPENLPDPIPAVDIILTRCPKLQLMTKYNLDEYTGTTDFLVRLAHRLGKLKKGGLPNTTIAARTVIRDWVTGKITFFTQPPECITDASNEHVDETVEDFSMNCQESENISMN